jgi:hypothetical protein
METPYGSTPTMRYSEAELRVLMSTGVGEEPAGAS